MKASLLFLISAVLIPFTGFAQHPTAGKGGTYTPTSNPTYQATPATYQSSPSTQQTNYSSPQVSKTSASPATVTQNTGATATISAPSHKVIQAKPQYSSHGRVARFDPSAICLDPKPTNLRQGPSGISDAPLEVPEKKTTLTKTEATDNVLVITKQTKPVIFYKHNLRIAKFNDLGGYGIQLGYYDNLAECKKELAQYKSRFKVAGFICEDWNITDKRFRLILGHYTHKSTAMRLFKKLQIYFPCCFIIKYA